MKKIFSLFICIIYFSTMPLACFADYDFSDEAQAEFDRIQQQIIITPENDYSKARKKKEIKSNTTDNFNNNQDINLPITQEYQNKQQNQSIKLQQYPPNNLLYGSVVQVPAGTSFEVAFDSGISSGSIDKNDRLTVRLTDDISYNGQIVAPAGSLVYGNAADATNAGYAYGSGSIALNFNQILTPDGNMLNISTRTIIIKSKSERAAKMTRDVLVGALGSMLVGAAFTALSGSNNWGRNMAIYGGVGAIGGGIHGAMQRGAEVQIPDGTIIKVTLSDTLSASPYKF